MPGAGLNVLIGRNAQGKSNLLEAIALLGTGKSFRTARDAELVREGIGLASVSAQARVAAGTLRLACTIAVGGSGTRKTYTVNGQGVRYARFLGSVRVVTFTPADLHLVSGPPSLRRATINAALAQEQPAYYADLARYQKILAQKNALLRGVVALDDDLLATYNAGLVESGTRLMLARRAYCAQLAVVANAAHRSWAPGAELHLAYEPNVRADVPTADGIAGAFIDALDRARTNELRRGSAIVGPHRDDVRLTLDTQLLAAYGSQGQQRTAVLALKAAEYAVLRERTGEAPVLILDDVLSELDPQRQAAFLEGVGRYEQVFIATTSEPVALPPAARFHVEGASVRAA